MTDVSDRANKQAVRDYVIDLILWSHKTKNPRASDDELQWMRRVYEALYDAPVEVLLNDRPKRKKLRSSRPRARAGRSRRTRMA
jgi:hypothetical protein